MACGALHSCAIAQKELLVWGSNREQQLGPHAGEAQFLCTPTLQLEGIGGLGVVSVECGLFHTAGVVQSTQQAYGFGSNQFGALGDMTADCAPFFPLEFAVAEVVCGNRHTAVRGADGQLLVFGWPAQASLGNCARVFAANWATYGLASDDGSNANTVPP